MPDTPHIILITCDHLRADTVGYAGDPAIRTPAIDALAAESVRFGQWFVQSPVCQPSRATIMTGRYPRHHGLKWNFGRLDDREVTLAEYLHQHGYQTAVVGKHHISQKRFADSLDHLDAAGIRNMKADNPFRVWCAERGWNYLTAEALEGMQERLGAVPSSLPAEAHLDAWVGLRTRDYLAQVDASRPQFLWVGFYGPHHPYVPSGEFATMYDDVALPPFATAPDDLALKPPEYLAYRDFEGHKFAGMKDRDAATWRAMKAAFYGMTSQIDWQMGLLLEALADRGILDDAVLIFTSDHGDLLGDHGLAGKGPFLLDSLLHVPCLLRAPGLAPADCHALTESVDLFPTVCALAGLPVAEWVNGHDLGPVLRGERESVRPAILAEAVDKRAVRTTDWKLIHYPGKPYGELYHVAEDPHELHNLYASEPGQVEAMTRLLWSRWDATEDFRHPAYARFGSGEQTHYLTW